MENKPQEEATQMVKPEPYGLKGWLMLFWISLVFISPLYALSSLNIQISSEEANIPGLEAIPLWVHLKGFFWISTICAIVILWVAGYYLCRRYEWKSVQITLLSIWITGPVTVIITGLYFYFMFTPFFDMMGKELVLNFFKSFIYPGIWTLYLLKSKRVKNTYVKNTNQSTTIQCQRQ